MSPLATSLSLTKHPLRARQLFRCLLLIGSLAGGAATSQLMADDRDRVGADAPHNEDKFRMSGSRVPDRVGADAPHQERNAPANEDKFRLAGPQVPVVSVTQSSEEGSTDIRIRKSTAGAAPSKTARTRKAKDSTAKVATQTKTETKPSAAPSKPVPASYFDNQRIGEDAPHQERNSDVNARGDRLLIWERE